MQIGPQIFTFMVTPWCISCCPAVFAVASVFVCTLRIFGNIPFRSLLSISVFMLESITCYNENNSSNLLYFTDKLSIQYLIWDDCFLSFPQTTKEMIARSCATIVTHPFHGISWMCETFKIIEIASTDSPNIMRWMLPDVLEQGCQT